VEHPIRQGDIPGVQLRCDRELPIPGWELWAWLTRTDRLERWLAESAWIEGDELRLESHFEAQPLRELGRTIHRVEDRLWVLAFERLDDNWKMATELRLEVFDGQPARLSVLQRGFERLSLSHCLSVWEFYRRRWRAALDRLAGELPARSV
jgi:hypothetical protein